MEGKQSVIARLMGFDEHQPLEAIHKPQRVLSENYLRKVASIGVGKKKNKKEAKEVCQRKGVLDLSFQKCAIGEEFHDSSKLDFFQKHKNDSVTCSERFDLVRQYESSSSHMRIIVLKPISGKAKRFGVKNVQCSVESIRQRSSASREIFKELKRIRRWRNLGFPKMNSSLGLSGGDTPTLKSEILSPPSTCSFEYSDKSTLSNRSKKQIWERCLLREKYKVETTSRISTLDELIALQDPISWPRNCKPGLDLSKFAKQQLKCEAYSNRWYLGLEKPLNQARSKMIIKHDFIKDMVVDKEIENTNKSFGESESEQLEPTMCISLEEDYDSSSLTTDTSTQQDSSTGFQEESSVFSHCSSIEPDSVMSFEEPYQPSPISVLELPFSSESLGRVKGDICDLKRQHQLPKSKTWYKEESSMVISSDDETDNDALMKDFKVEESRNISYLIELLKEVNLLGKNIEEFSSWDSLEFPISVSVFETLEKKYGDQMSWKRSDRLLLFDSINAGLVEIILPCIGEPTCEMSVSRRLSPIRDAMEDLLKLRVGNEKEYDKAKNSKEIVMGSELGKIDLGDEIYVIVMEIQKLLFDELAAELFSM
ncbi:hypothetical protein F8388_023425 [Cannabis sativa]|uniref:DUF4378 domain-containing protein n=1 Tax=Cannabis sativa TaxID=3483 RepID=A0A7J6HFD5_CANSA|nr:hypothetical protein F8388_023425 [Cannabis sativa]